MMECIANFSLDSTPEYIESCALPIYIYFNMLALFFTLTIMYISIRRRYKPTNIKYCNQKLSEDRETLPCSVCDKDVLISDNSDFRCNECNFFICDFCWVENEDCLTCGSYLSDEFSHS